MSNLSSSSKRGCCRADKRTYCPGSKRARSSRTSLGSSCSNTSRGEDSEHRLRSPRRSTYQHSLCTAFYLCSMCKITSHKASTGCFKGISYTCKKSSIRSTRSLCSSGCTSNKTIVDGSTRSHTADNGKIGISGSLVRMADRGSIKGKIHLSN